MNTRREWRFKVEEAEADFEANIRPQIEALQEQASKPGIISPESCATLFDSRVFFFSHCTHEDSFAVQCN